MQLFDFQASAFRQALFQFGQGQAQNAVHILSLDLVGIHAGDVKASLVGAVGTLHTDHFILLVLFLDLGFSLGPDDQSVILDVQSDVLLLKAGQVSLQQVVVALVRHIGAELSKSRHVKEAAEIAGCFRNGVCIDPENLALHLRARLRIISMAQEKIDRIDEILSNVKERDHLIVYCGDGKLYDDNDEEIRHINFAKRALLKRDYKPSQFTASENMAKRIELVELFNDGSIDALVAIRCLDEGINIPSIAGALILASNDDYREFVQRRGRILRTYGTKEFGHFFSGIVLPRPALH